MPILHRCAVLLGLLAAALPILAETNSPAKGPEQKFAAILIWGTDGEKPKNKELKDVNPELQATFKNIFKWKNYYEVTRTNANLKVGSTTHLKLSKKCEVKINQTASEGMEVELIGEGKIVYKGNHSMPLKDILILAGDDKNKTAWFVVLKPE